MKVALCLYGQPRNLLGNWGYIAQNIIFPYSPDIFFHTWYDQNHLGIDKMTPGHENISLPASLESTLISQISPKRYKIEPQIKFYGKSVVATEENIEACWPWSRGYDREIFLKNRVACSYSMWYSVNQSLLLKELYSQQYEFEYDCVILSRFDVSPKTILDLSNLDLSKINSGYQSLPREEINDWFIVMNNQNSNIISSLFYSLDFYRERIVKVGGIWTNEAYLRDHIKQFNLSVDYTNMNITF